MTQIVHHHVKYKEIHGVDEIVLMTRSEHTKLHRRIRKEGKCRIPPDQLQLISTVACYRRLHPFYTSKEWSAWKKFRGFERENEGRPLYQEIHCG